MLHIILFQPDIPQNTGNIGRLCSVTQSRLHLIHPLGFEISDRHLKRAGMDYWKTLDVHEHADWDAFMASPFGPDRIWLFTTHAEQSFWNISFADNDGLLFGRETSGSPAWLHEWAAERRVTIPQFNEAARSLNLATSAAVATYEALRQIKLAS